MPRKTIDYHDLMSQVYHDEHRLQAQTMDHLRACIHYAEGILNPTCTDMDHRKKEEKITRDFVINRETKAKEHIVHAHEVMKRLDHAWTWMFQAFEDDREVDRVLAVMATTRIWEPEATAEISPFAMDQREIVRLEREIEGRLNWHWQFAQRLDAWLARKGSKDDLEQMKRELREHEEQK